ncbi:(E)-4-hydroxy-3-methylbut-2-enyl-diphosphate synthase [Microscilla marina]|uniref:4-hydroxy-3-methylbut-2-en-1-yl diphosphate synthase (flavodoxin) n=1 Tax=Microscilla marina ATCC 23134 TaxID=313606 RepID=A1ZV25_MICM2|nr:(E)-4-hydroxy-3-methylbut-2-enyl-diphosphate synthase [Microscilla marina]EAY25803.1 4-hydroxy-3-methylbut-2-en-1-yl diphosphate synthase [Microscilla marina ATCC 23134]
MSSIAETTLYRKLYTQSLTEFKRRQSIEVNIGNVPLGGKQPIRVQSMTTVDTMDTEGSIAQAIRMIDAGCEYVRITAPSIKEAQNLQNIKEGLRAKGYQTPLVADIHFTPNAAELAAGIVEKVRVNPGNYADKKKFEIIEYTDEQYQEELQRIRERFEPLVKLCKANKTAMRIGTNHGSLSDRIMSRYGDTPLGMVESALEFLRICEDLAYYDIVISMKASNPQVMVQAYRLLVQKLDEEGLKPYPLHLGVTEAGEGEDGRIKSAMGIGALLEDGLGDTVRVSLTEEPEAEMPVGKKLVDRYLDRANHSSITPFDWQNASIEYSPYAYQKRTTKEVSNFGHDNVPRVIADYSTVNHLQVDDLKSVGHYYLPELDKWGMNDLGADYIYLGKQLIPFMMPNGLKVIQDYSTWQKEKEQSYPALTIDEYMTAADLGDTLRFLYVQWSDFSEDLIKSIKNDHHLVLILSTDNSHAMAELRRVFFELMEQGLELPVVVKRDYAKENIELVQLYASTDVGGLLIDGWGDGIMLSNGQPENKEELLEQINQLNNLSFGILQAARTRMTKTEYISCPSCGRTLFDLQETTAMIRKRTDHLKGVKIGIMGCIVNGPGEMADADYGYVGSGKGKITLYRSKTVVKRGVPSEHAVDELIELIREDGRWLERTSEN